MTIKIATGEIAGSYRINEAFTENQLMELALKLAKKRLRKGRAITEPSDAARSLQTMLHDKPYEVFGMVLLDNKHRILNLSEMFRGTIDASAVYPREVVKTALEYNAAAVIFFHNHPSGDPEPSEGDQRLTTRLKTALETVDIRVLDHFVVGVDGWISFAEKGLL